MIGQPFGMFRTVNKKVVETCGKDSGFDIMHETIDTDKLAKKMPAKY